MSAPIRTPGGGLNRCGPALSVPAALTKNFAASFRGFFFLDRPGPAKQRGD